MDQGQTAYCVDVTKYRHAYEYKACLNRTNIFPNVSVKGWMDENK